MKLSSNPYIEACFGSDAKWLELSHLNVKGVVIHADSMVLSDYDSRQIQKFVSSGVYAELYKRLHEFIGTHFRIVLSLEASVAWINVVDQRPNELRLVKRFRCGFIYGRSVEEIFESTVNFYNRTFIAELTTVSRLSHDFFTIFSKDELDSDEKVSKAILVFEDIRGGSLRQRDEVMLRRQIVSLQA